MAIELTLGRVLVERKVKARDLAREIGVTEVNLSRIKTNKAKAMRFSTLDLLCEALDCQPGDIIKRIDSQDELKR